ncbi:unspecific monooxygenase [Sarracenia purpurea var. burkii]
MTNLWRHPRTMKELQKEVRRVVDGKLDITDDDLEKLTSIPESRDQRNPPSPSSGSVTGSARSQIGCQGDGLRCRRSNDGDR